MPTVTKCEKCGEVKPLIAHPVKTAVRNGRRVNQVFWCAACGDPPNKVRQVDLVESPESPKALKDEIDRATSVDDLKKVLRKMLKRMQ